MKQSSKVSVVEAIGFEGDLPEQCQLTWGALAIRHDNVVINSVTGRSISIEKLGGFVSAGYVWLFSAPITMPEPALSKAFNAVIVRRSLPIADQLGDTLAAQAYAVSEKGADPAVYIIERGTAFTSAQESACDLIVKEVQAESHQARANESTQGLIRSGLILDPFHPELNAFRVLNAAPETREDVMALAQACIRSTTGAERFYNALKRHGLA